MRDEPAILLDQVAKTLKRRRVLDGISLAVGAGERIALVGSNGAGKTSLIRCLLGEYECQGDVRLFGRSPRLDRRQVLETVGFVPQLPPPLRMPVGELISFAAAVSNCDPDRIAATSEKLGLELDASVRRQPFVKLSGGQKQKLLIGIALARPCRLLLMDEPAANLDPESRQAFFRMLGDLESRTTMVISSHRLDEVAALVNRVVELDRGRVVLDDHVADAVDPTSSLACRVRLLRHESAFAQALRQWGFRATEDELDWQGQVAGPDRLRFLGMMSRYAGIIAGFDMTEERKAQGAAIEEEVSL